MGKNDEKYKPFTDEDKILFGKHSGRKLANVPASYLLWLWDQPKFHHNGYEHEVRVRLYIKDNLEVLKKEVSEQSKLRKYNG